MSNLTSSTGSLSIRYVTQRISCKSLVNVRLSHASPGYERNAPFSDRNRGNPDVKAQKHVKEPSERREEHGSVRQEEKILEEATQWEERNGTHEGSGGKSREENMTHILPKHWTARLRSTMLGETASVLVFRDNEKAPRKRGMFEMMLKPLKEVEPAQLVASIDASRKSPGQIEVNAAIDALRPAAPAVHGQGSPVISREELYQMIQSLSQKFSENQLSRYMTIKAGERLMSERMDTKGEKSHDENPYRKFSRAWFSKVWKPLKILDHPQVIAAQRRKLTGKGAVIDSLIHETWGIEIWEETQHPGSIVLGTDPPQLSLLRADTSSDSIIAKVTGQHNVKIKLDEKHKAIQIRGSRSDCVSAAVSVQRHLEQYREIDLPLDLLNRPTKKVFCGSLELAEAYRIANRMGCTLIETKNKRSSSRWKSRIWLLGAFGQHTLESCVRAILAAAHDTYRKAVCFTSSAIAQEDGDDGAERMNLVYDHIDNTGHGNTLQGEDVRRKGRYTLPTRIGKGATPARLNVNENLIIEDTFDQSINYLEHGPDLNAIGDVSAFEPKNIYSARVGQFRWPDDAHRPTRKTTSQTFHNDDVKPPTFEHTVMGLPQLLHRLPHLREQPPVSTTSELRVKLILHPLSAQQISSEFHRPTLCLTFTPHPTHRAMTFKDATVQYPSTVVSESNILLPALATDVQLSHMRSLKYPVSERKLDRQLKAFIHLVESSGSGYGRVSAPADAVLYTPFWPVKPAQKIREGPKYSQWFVGMRLFERKMFTSAIELAQEIRWDLPLVNDQGVDISDRSKTTGDIERAAHRSPLQLVYTRTSGGVDQGTPSRGTLEVQFHTGFREEALPSEKRKAFLSSVNAILSELNRRIGLMQMLMPTSRPLEDSSHLRNEQLITGAESMTLQ